MKKALLYFSLFAFHFAQGQAIDTLIFKTGTKLAVKIFYIDRQKIYFTVLNGKAKESVTKTQLDTVIYAKGFIDPILPDYDSLANHGQKGHFVVNVGIGYSPGFNGDVGFGGLFFPVNRNSEYFSCSSITPNMGGAIDYGFSRKWSAGLAASYQSEIIRDNDYSNLNANKITRTNFAVRFLKHLNKRHPNFDDYFGLRIGCSYWVDKPILSGENKNLAVSIPFYYFLETPNPLVPSIQFLYGIHFYASDNFGIHFEAGIGSPFLVEGGITFRFLSKNK